MRRRWFLKLARRRRLEQDLEAELAFHREMSGAHQNPIQLGNLSSIKEQALDLWRFNWIENFWRDFMYAGRALRKSPAVLICALLSLAFGTGANTAIFELLDAVRMRALPVQRPHELAAVQIVGGHGGMGMNPGEYPELTRPMWQEVRRNQRGFSGIFAWSADQVNVGEDDDLHRVKAMWVSGDFYNVLGVRPWRGRLISSEDEGPCPGSTAVVSYAYWQTAMGGSPVDGNSTSVIDGVRTRIIGVEPPDFVGLSVGDRFDVMLPLCRPNPVRREVFDVAVMGRLRSSWNLKRASDQLRSISPAIFENTAPQGYSPEEVQKYKRLRLGVFPAAQGVSVLREQYDSSLWLLLGVSGLVLLIGCANLANLLLARASTRDREMAVRLALGASGKRLISQLLAEGALLAVSGAALGVLLAQVFSGVLLWALSTEGNSVVVPVGMDWRVLGFTATLCAVTCLFFTALPARRATRADPITAMRAAGRGMTMNLERAVVQRCLVVVQISVSLVLLVGASLFVRSFRNLMTYNPGMREANITVAFLAFDRAHVASNGYLAFQRELVNEVRSIPGVLNAASTTNVPLTRSSWEHVVHVGHAKGLAKFTWVSPGYFDTMGIPVIMGRQFRRDDRGESTRVAVVNRMFIRRYLGGENPIGHVLRTDPEPDYPSAVYQIVGVIPDTKYNDLRGNTPPMVFAPATQYPAPGPFVALVIHSNIPSIQLVTSIKRTLRQTHPEVVAVGGDFQQWIRDGFVRDRVMATLSAIFGFIAALLAVIGLYGVVSYLVASRRNEIGVRMALGAGRWQVIGMTLNQAWRLLLVGTCVGLVLASAGGFAAKSLLFGLSSYDPVTLAMATALLAVICMAASFFPARKASKLDPMTALRYE